MTASIHALSVSADDGTRILDQVDLNLPEATVTALIGASGAGKTTLAHALLGHLGPGLHRTGVVRVAQHDPFTPAGQRALRGRIIGYLPQDPASALDPRRPVAAQLRTAARIAHPGDTRADCAARVRDAARSATLEPRLLAHRPGQLSGGQAQRALLAWAFIAQPRLLVLDEPTSGLDPDTARGVAAAFTTLPWRPAVLLISHDPHLVARSADCAVELEHGRLCPVRASLPPPQAPSIAEPNLRETTDNVLAASRVRISRGGKTLVSDGRVALTRGELVAVRGTSGSGKTSLARALCGLAPPDAGELTVHGQRADWDAATRARTGGAFIAYVGQDARAALNPHDTVRRALDRAREAAMLRRRAGWDHTALLDQFGLPQSVADRTPDRLSGGQRHRVALAQAVAAGPAVLICDETTAALDRATACQVLDTLDDIRHHTGLPILLITHQDEVAARADRILTLAEGRLA